MAIYGFFGKYRFLSNYYELKTPLIFEGIEFSTSEAAYQAAKTLCMERRKQIASVGPNRAKRMGQSVTLRHDWEAIKVDIMTKIVRDKFNRSLILAKCLINTHPQDLIEANTWGDMFWGVDKKTGHGENILGKTLMLVRDELMATQTCQ